MYSSYIACCTASHAYVTRLHARPYGSILYIHYIAEDVCPTNGKLRKIGKLFIILSKQSAESFSKLYSCIHELKTRYLLKLLSNFFYFVTEFAIFTIYVVICITLIFFVLGYSYNIFSHLFFVDKSKMV